MKQLEPRTLHQLLELAEVDEAAPESGDDGMISFRTWMRDDFGKVTELQLRGVQVGRLVVAEILHEGDAQKVYNFGIFHWQSGAVMAHAGQFHRAMRVADALSTFGTDVDTTNRPLLHELAIKRMERALMAYLKSEKDVPFQQFRERWIAIEGYRSATP